jgi:hypothetical protein
MNGMMMVLILGSTWLGISLHRCKVYFIMARSSDLSLGSFTSYRKSTLSALV